MQIPFWEAEQLSEYDGEAVLIPYVDGVRHRWLRVTAGDGALELSIENRGADDPNEDAESPLRVGAISAGAVRLLTDDAERTVGVRVELATGADEALELVARFGASAW